MNELQIFNNPEFGEVRIVDNNGEIWFVGKDVAEKLGYKNPNEAIADHVEAEDKLNSKTLSSLKLELGQRGGWLINEGGLYSLTIRSNMPNAKKFTRWLTHEVIPSIRRQGVYMTAEAAEKVLYNPDFIIGLARQIKDAQAKIAELEPKADYYEKVLQSPETILTTTIAKAYGMSAVMFNKLLDSYAIQYYRGGCWHLHSKYASKGYVEYETRIIGNITRQQMKWTEKGKHFLYNALKAKGILPLRERKEQEPTLFEGIAS